MIQAPTNSTGDDPQDDTPLSFEVWLVRYWYILLIILAVLVVLIVLVCACVFRRHSQATFQQQHRLNNSNKYFYFVK
jgi:flagellar basal body-associated protein FliL